ncbi:hypothetical protein KW787_01610 [Candidatus Pacearchaeota archaeon]|nr:hypothetical protein [Candidatus Pacearchaeota archaeon]
MRHKSLQAYLEEKYNPPYKNKASNSPHDLRYDKNIISKQTFEIPMIENIDDEARARAEKHVADYYHNDGYQDVTNELNTPVKGLQQFANKDYRIEVTSTPHLRGMRFVVTKIQNPKLK